jgi:Tol biopolymer transport system component
MSLPAGTRLGPYEIVAPIGAGGMGEVYRARDTRPSLGREVAIKVLPSSFSSDTERLRRFEQEARAAGMLNHPNIVVIHDIGVHEGAPYVVTELLEGETLRSRLAGGALPQRKAIEYSLQIARGLAAAHEKGIVHRDLKPENLFITKDGRLKILDFGLAKLTLGARASSPAVPSASPAAGGTPALPGDETEVAGTQPGMVLGTVGYMSPEQVRGKAADHRADIFSFGAILYEMVAGRRAFHRDTPADTMTAILKEEPPELPPAAQLPPALERIIRHCLEKNPEERFRSAHDLGFALENVSGVSGSAIAAAGIAPAASRAMRWRRVLPWAVAALALALAVVLVALILRLPAPAARQAMRLAILLPEGYTFPGFYGTVELSPDGTRLVYSAERNGRTQLFLRPLDSPQATPLAGTEDAADAFFSPDGRWLGFFTFDHSSGESKLKKLPLAGGEPAVILSTWYTGGGAWTADDTILFSPYPWREFSRVPAAGGTPSRAFHVERGTAFPAQVLPDGKTVLFISGAGAEVCSLDGSGQRVIVERAQAARYAPPGYIVFVRDDRLSAAPFDLPARRLTGPPVPLAEVATTSTEWYFAFAVSAAGHLVYAPRSSIVRSAARTLNWVDRQGRATPLNAPPRAYNDVAFSRDGKLLAFVIQAAEHNVWTYDVARGSTSRLSFGKSDMSPVWTPNGKYVTYLSGGAPRRIVRRAVSGQGGEEVLWTDPRPLYPRSYSPDGRWLAVQRWDPNTSPDIYLLSSGPDRKFQPLLNSRFVEAMPEFSPDGRWLAYTSNETGRSETYVAEMNFAGSFPAIERKWQISADGGSEPRWSRNSRELFFRSGNRLLSVEYQSQPAFTPSKPRVLFEAPYVMHWVLPAYDVHPDGRLLMMKAESSGINELHVILNWTELLKHAGSAPAGKSEARP